VVDIELVDDEEEEDDDDEVEVEQGSLQGSWGGSEVEEVEEELVELDPVELLTSLYGNTPRIGAVVVESSCLFILILDIVVVGNSWQGEQDSKEIEQ